MTVFIIQPMGGRDFSDATAFGELVVLIPADEQATLSVQPLVRRMLRKLSHFTDDDYLLLSGDPAAIAVAASLAALNNSGRFKMLKYDRQEERYFPLSVNLYHRPGALNDN